MTDRPSTQDSGRSKILDWFTPIPAGELSAGGGGTTEWLWTGWAARGHFTLLSGFWKSGKSTLLSHVFRSTDDGGDIAGKIEPCRVLVLAEESRQIWNGRVEQVGIGDNVHFLCRPLKGRASMQQWSAMLDEAGSYAADLVIIDTLSYFWPVENENDASMVQGALIPLQYLAERGKAVVACHHPKKGESGLGQSARGSGALSGAADILAEFSRFDALRHDDPRRKLRGLSRFDETPSDVVIELTEHGYRTIGKPQEADRQAQIATAQAILKASNTPLKYDAVFARWPEPKPGLSTVKRTLNLGAEQGQLGRSGTGTKGSAYQFFSLTVAGEPNRITEREDDQSGGCNSNHP